MKEWFEAFSERLYFWGRESVLFLTLFSKLFPGQFERITCLLSIMETRVKPIHPFTVDDWYRNSSSFIRHQMVREDPATGQRFIYTYAWRVNGPVVKNIMTELNEFMIRNGFLQKLDIETFHWVKHHVLPLARKILDENCEHTVSLYGRNVQTSKQRLAFYNDNDIIELNGVIGTGVHITIQCPNASVKQELLTMDARYHIFKIIFGDEFINVNLSTISGKQNEKGQGVVNLTNFSNGFVNDR